MFLRTFLFYFRKNMFFLNEKYYKKQYQEKERLSFI